MTSSLIVLLGVLYFVGLLVTLFIAVFLGVEDEEGLALLCGLWPVSIPCVLLWFAMAPVVIILSMFVEEVRAAAEKARENFRKK